MCNIKACTDFHQYLLKYSNVLFLQMNEIFQIGLHVNKEFHT